MIPKKPLIYTVDDDPAVLKALPRSLQVHGLEVEAYASCREFLDNYQDRHGCLILDLSMPEMDGLQLQEELARLNIDIPIIFITGHGGVPESVQAIRAGAVDFLEKPFLTEVLMERITEALEQDRRNRGQRATVQNVQDRFFRLTDRERDVLRLLVSEKVIPSSKEMARVLDISHRTVEHHRSRILEKTQTGSVPELRALIERVHLDISQL